MDGIAGTAAPPASLRFSFQKKQRVSWILAGFGLLFAVTMLASVGLGAISIPPDQVLSILLSRIGIDIAVPFDQQQELVLVGIRLPRVLLGAAIGAGLAVSGALMQGLFRNPLADPGLVGVSSGAALGASGMIVMGGSFAGAATSIFWSFGVALAAFVCGLFVAVVVYRLATLGGRTSVATMLLAGIAVNAICSSGTGALVLLSNDNQLRDVTFWMLGSLGGATWSVLYVLLPFVLTAVLAAPRLARALNALLLGEAEARHLGIRVETVKRAVIALAVLAVGASTAVAGLIGFVGLVVPHLVRLLTGPDHRTLLPGSALLGASLLLLADLVARILIQPAEIPIGIVTAFGGAPFFLALLVRQQQKGQTYTV